MLDDREYGQRVRFIFEMLREIGLLFFVFSVLDLVYLNQTEQNAHFGTAGFLFILGIVSMVVGVIWGAKAEPIY
jgi:hypothetical protein